MALKVLFIGGTGNISRLVGLDAVGRGIDLFCLNRGKRGVSIQGARTIVGDVSDVSTLRGAAELESWDVVVDWIAFKEEDVRRDVEMFNGRTKQYIFISSASCYQKPPTSPYITESTPLSNPFWKYSRDKIACEQYLMDRHQKEGFPATIVRPSHTYDTIVPVPIGGGTEYTIIERIKNGRKVISHGDGTSLWVLTHSEDFAKGFLGLLGRGEAIGEAYHITSDEVLTWDGIYDAIGRAVGTEVKKVHIPSDVLASYDESYRGGLLGDKAYSVIFDNSKIRRLVPSFRASMPFEEGIRRTLDWFEADPARQIVRPETNVFVDSAIERFGKALR